MSLPTKDIQFESATGTVNIAVPACRYFRVRFLGAAGSVSVKTPSGDSVQVGDGFEITAPANVIISGFTVVFTNAASPSGVIFIQG